jgi:hypothetical protein
LDIVEWFRRYIPQKDRVEVAEINAEFKCGRATKYLDTARLKISLNFSSALCRQLSCVLLNHEITSKAALVERPIVVVREECGIYANEATSASASKARIAEGERLDSIAPIAAVDRVARLHRCDAPPIGVQTTAVFYALEQCDVALQVGELRQMSPDCPKRCVGDGQGFIAGVALFP